MTIWKAIKNGIGMTAMLLWLVFAAILVLAVGVVGAVGSWDLLAWLTKADWHHTGFRVPVLGLVAGFVAWCGLHAMIEIVEWSDDKPLR